MLKTTLEAQAILTDAIRKTSEVAGGSDRRAGRPSRGAGGAPGASASCDRGAGPTASRSCASTSAPPPEVRVGRAASGARVREVVEPVMVCLQIRELMASGALPSELPSFERRGSLLVPGPQRKPPQKLIPAPDSHDKATGAS